VVDENVRGYVGVGGEGGGIFAWRLDAASGAVELGPRACDDADIAFLAAGAGGRCLYAATSDASVSPDSTTPRGLARAYRVDPVTGALRRIDERPTGGRSPCYLAVAPGGRALRVANFRAFGKYGNAGHRSRGSLCVLPIEADGALGPAAEVRVHEGHSVHPDRQTASHPHGIHPHPDGRWLADALANVEEFPRHVTPLAETEEACARLRTIVRVSGVAGP
jgi:6-phosphogluconolactonase